MYEVKFLDTTLRDGEQAPGVAFTNNQRLELAGILDRLGVDIIEAGIPAMGMSEMNNISDMLSLGLRAQILTWNRMNIEDIKKSIECGARNIHFAAPVSDLHIVKKLKKSRQWVMDAMRQAVEYCINRDCTVSVGAEDASRADEDFLLDFYESAVVCGACRIRYADTVGIQDPFTVHAAIRRIRGRVTVDIDYHGHNDFGMSTGNAYAAYMAGANVISCSINGLGERAGNTPLEEIAMAIKHIAKQPVSIDTKLFSEASELVERYSRRLVHDGKAVVGRSVHLHESGIHVDGLLKDKNTYQPYAPEEVGRKSEIVLGKFSGRKAIEHVYRLQGQNLTVEQTDAIYSALKGEAGALDEPGTC